MANLHLKYEYISEDDEQEQDDENVLPSPCILYRFQCISAFTSTSSTSTSNFINLNVENKKAKLEISPHCVRKILSFGCDSSWDIFGQWYGILELRWLIVEM